MASLLEFAESFATASINCFVSVFLMTPDGKTSVVYARRRFKFRLGFYFFKGLETLHTTRNMPTFQYNYLLQLLCKKLAHISGNLQTPAAKNSLDWLRSQDCAAFMTSSLVFHREGALILTVLTRLTNLKRKNKAFCLTFTVHLSSTHFSTDERADKMHR
jgi:hypothetical protein